MARDAPMPKEVAGVLRQPKVVSVIAEVKHLNPAISGLGAIPDPGHFAGLCEQGGAACISVLIGDRHFGRGLDDLDMVRRAVDVPVLCKDVVVSSYQVWEARAHGADLILLIVAALEQEALVSLIERAESLGMSALVETHNEAELERALAAGASLIGINAQDIISREVDRRVFSRLAPLVPSSKVLVAASGVRSPADLLTYARQGANAVLVGEHLATASDPERVVAELVAMGSHPSIQSIRT